jgi:hypothetical protein
MEKHLCVGSLPKESDAQAMPQLNKSAYDTEESGTGN